MLNLVNRVFFITCLLWSTLVVAQNLPTESRVPGGVALITLPTQFSSPNPPVVYYQKQRVAVIPSTNKSQTQWIAVIGIPLSAKVGQSDLEIKQGKRIVKQTFSILPKQYQEEKITIKSKKHVDPNPEHLKRIKKEYAQLNQHFSSWSSNPKLVPTLQLPVKGRLSGDFGKRRIINGQPRSPHKGIDIAAPKGTPVYSAQKGKVIDVGDYFYTGNTIMIDHGQGFKTIYCHLDSIQVKLNQQVNVREQIGTVGQTGRATGPHLHFGVNLNNARISPELFFVN